MPEAVDAAIAHGASHVGFVFYARSPRAIEPEAAGALATPDFVERVGVFVDPADDLLDHAISAGRLQVLQVHDATAERLAAIGRRGLELWSVVAVKARRDLEAAKLQRADRVLYDAKTPAGALPGGMGVRFDWSLLEGFAHPRPWGLSGGLDANNLAEAVRITRAPLVDVSSGVESAPGVKDVDKIAAFLKASLKL